MTTTSAAPAPTERLVRDDHRSIQGILQQLALTRTYAEVGRLLGMSKSWVEATMNKRRPKSRAEPKNVRRIAKVIGYDAERVALMLRPPTESL
jgi:hypothetical protein